MPITIKTRVKAMKAIQNQAASAYKDLTLKDVDDMLAALKASENELKADVNLDNLHDYLEHALIVSHILSEKLNMKFLSDSVFETSLLIKTTSQKIIKMQKNN